MGMNTQDVSNLMAEMCQMTQKEFDDTMFYLLSKVHTLYVAILHSAHNRYPERHEIDKGTPNYKRIMKRVNSFKKKYPKYLE